jgi:hypothetical protein
MALDRTVTPPLYQERPGVDTPVETVGTTDKTAYLHIDLKVNPPNGGAKALPMTAVFAPDPARLAGEVDVLLWFHGDKKYWQSDGQNGAEFWGQSIRHYLNNLPMCRLRDFILRTKKNFLLVAPTLNDFTGGGEGGLPAGLLYQQADAEAYLQQALNGANKHLGARCTKVGNIVLAAHSGGGHIQARMAGDFGGTPFDRVNEVWCFDSTYWGAEPLRQWAEKGHGDARLFVYSLGKSGPSETGDAARALLRLTKPTPPPPPPPPGKPNFSDVIAKGGAGVPVAVLRARSDATFRTVMRSLTDIEVLVEHDRENKTNPAWAAYGGGAGGHYESIPKYLPRLVAQSKNLA